MILSRRVSLGGQQLDELDERIVIRSVNPGVPNEALGATERMGGVGQRLTSQHWNSLDVIVTYAIDVPKTDLKTRKEIFDAVNSWALKGGWLKVNYIKNRRLYVDKVIVPGSGDLFNWTNEYTLTFRAYNVPFWTDTTPESVTKQVSNGSISIDVPGQVQTVLNATLQNVCGQTISDISIKVGKNTLKFAGINLGGTATLTISHGHDGLLRAKVGDTSVYNKITGGEDLYADPGVNTVTIESKRALKVTIEATGRYV